MICTNAIESNLRRNEKKKNVMGNNSRETQKQTKYLVVEIEHPNDNGI